MQSFVEKNQPNFDEYIFIGFIMFFENQQIIRDCKMPQVLQISRGSLADIQNPLSPRFDPTFPKKIKIGARSAGYLLKEVSTWLESRKLAVSPVVGGGE